MAKKRIRLVITLEVEAEDADVVDVAFGPAEDDVALPDDALDAIVELAPDDLREFELLFVGRCADELGCDLRKPAGGRTYLNLLPPKRFGTKRAAAMEVKTGRVEIYCDPGLARGRKGAEVVKNNDEPVAVKVYLRSEEAVNIAVDLTARGLQARRRIPRVR